MHAAASARRVPSICCQIGRLRASAPRSAAVGAISASGPLLIRQLIAQQAGVTEDYHQQVVEVVSDNARQLANGFGPARLLQLRFKPEPASDIGADTEDGAGLTIRAGYQGPATLDGNPMAVLATLFEGRGVPTGR